MLRWSQRFLNRCHDDSLAKRAWLRLETAGLRNSCYQLLWEYANGQRQLAEIQCGTKILVRNIQAFQRAHRQEQHHANDARVQMFRERRENAFKVLAQTPWPLRNLHIATFADAVRANPALEWFDLRRVRGLIERSGLRYLLAILRACAKEHKVNLSGNEIAALAYCATGSAHDAGAIRRYLRQPWIPIAEADYQARFDSFITSTQ